MAMFNSKLLVYQRVLFLHSHWLSIKSTKYPLVNSHRTGELRNMAYFRSDLAQIAKLGMANWGAKLKVLSLKYLKWEKW